MIYDMLEKDQLVELLFRADTTIEALRDRDEARDELAKERRKHEDTTERLERSNRMVDRYAERLKELASLPSYNDTLGKLCTEFGVPGSPNLNEVIANVKKRLRRK